ncbi:trypsin-like serine protease [Pendulispora albinea]|uniref:Trypsin-like serine protease n=1 Tax=Pendulispora albinea TaxID=2741071 RepID=A0ABZ2LUK0_9BACT
MNSSGVFLPMCSATLVTPLSILTAKHCALALMSRSPPTDLAFAVGENATEPDRRVGVLNVKFALPNEGGFTGRGSDVAVWRLRDELPGVVPLEIATQSLVSVSPGTRLLTIGYGAASVEESRSGAYAWHRRAGVQTMRAARGRLLEMIYGNPQNCRLDRSVARRHRPCGSPVIAMDCSAYDRTVLLDGYEAWAGGAEGDAQTCQGDSGGPLLIDSDGAMKIVGVTSWSWHSSNQRCDYGTVYAAIGDDVREMTRQLRMDGLADTP